MTAESFSQLAAHVLQSLPLHMGRLHAYENILVLAIAFGPFLVLGVVVYFVRRRDIAEEPETDEIEESRADAGPEVSPGRRRAT